MELVKGIKIVDLALYLEKENSLIIADIHIGFEEALNKQGLLVPRFQYKELVDRINNIIDNIKKNNKITKLKKIIIAGDLKHEFGTISEQEWRETLRFLDFLLENCEELILIKGNHDTILGPIAGKRGIKIVESYKVDSILIIHGHKLPKKEDLKGIKTIIIAHEHPAVLIRDQARSELFKCFLKGKWKNKNLIVMPSSNLVTEGLDLMKEERLSPLLKQDISDFEVSVIADKTYYFGKLKNLS